MLELFVPMTAKQRRVGLDALLLLAGFYLRDCARESRREGELGEEHIVCAVRGTPCDPFARSAPASLSRDFEIWIEGHGAGRSLRVVTRNADPITCDIAAGFARRCAAQWGTAVETRLGPAAAPPRSTWRIYRSESAGAPCEGEVWAARNRRHLAAMLGAPTEGWRELADAEVLVVPSYDGGPGIERTVGEWRARLRAEHQGCLMRPPRESPYDPPTGPREFAP